MLKDFLNGWQPTDRTIKELTRLLGVCIAYPGIREVFIYSKIFNNPDDEFLNKVNVLAYRPQRTQEAMETFQKPQATLVEGFNSQLHTLGYFFDESDTPKYCFSDSYKLILQHYKIQQQMFYSGFLWVFVVPLEGIQKYKKELKAFGMKAPLILKLHPYRYSMYYKGKLVDGTIEQILYEWILNIKNGIPSCESVEECPWILIWMKWMPSVVVPSEFLNQSAIKKNIVKIGQRRNRPTDTTEINLEVSERLIAEALKIKQKSDKTALDLLF